MKSFISANVNGSIFRMLNVIDLQHARFCTLPLQAHQPKNGRCGTPRRAFSFTRKCLQQWHLSPIG
jgi:hypothetical protein